MTYGMKLLDQSGQVASIELAGALLRAWVKGDRPALDAELDRSSQTTNGACDSEEDERLQMLNAIAVRMKGCVDPFASGATDVGISVCLKLLSHLAGASAPRRSTPEWSSARPVTRFEMPGSFHSQPVRLGTSVVH